MKQGQKAKAKLYEKNEARMEAKASWSLLFATSSPKLNMITKGCFFLPCLKNWLILDQSLSQG